MQWDKFGKKSSIENFFDAILFGGHSWQSTGSHLICHVCFSYYGFRRFPWAQEGQTKVQKGPSYAVWQSYLVPTLLNICTTWFTTDLLYNLIYFEVLMNAVPSHIWCFWERESWRPKGVNDKTAYDQVDVQQLTARHWWPLVIVVEDNKVVCRHPLLQLA